MDVVSVPRAFQSIFEKAEEYVKEYFSLVKMNPERGNIEIQDERYILIRSKAMSLELFEYISKIFSNLGEEKAISITRDLLYELAHMIGYSDAINFHKRMKVVDPISKLSAGPIHFAYTGWAYVNILPESTPTPDKEYYLTYYHPYSFEADSWVSKKKKSSFPVCVMNAGYSSGWCEASFGIPLVAFEDRCRAMGDENCHFVMVHKENIDPVLTKKLENYPKIKSRFRIPNIIEQLAFAEKIKEEHNFNQTLLKAIPFGMDIVDTEGNILFYNENMSSIEGIGKGKKCWEIYKDDKKQCSYCPLKKGLAIGEQATTQTAGVLGGKIFKISHIGLMYRGKNAVLEIFQDITEQTKNEKMLEEKVREFEIVHKATIDRELKMVELKKALEKERAQK